MTTSSLRIIAAGIAVIFAVLTGILTGVVGSPEVCTTVEQPTAPNQDQQPGTGRRGGGDQQTGEPEQPGQDQDQDQDQGGDPTGEPTQPGPGGGLPGDPDGGGGGSVSERGEVRPLAVEQLDCESSGFSPTAAIVGFFGALLAGGAVAALLFVRRRETPGGAVMVPQAASPNGSQGDGKAENERALLVQNCIYVRDRVTSKALADRLGWALQEVGVTAVTPAGVPFDPAHHEAGGSSKTNDPSKVGTIAAVEVPGYLDRGAVLRAPVVTVYRQDGQ